MRVIEYTVPEEFDGKKVYNFLRGYVKISTRLMRTLKRIPDGIMLGEKQGRTIDIIRTGDKITLNIPEDETAPIPIEYPLDIVYEDEDLLIINKPPMLAMHESHNHQGDTLANAVSYYLGSKGKSASFRAVGRLDKGTSGLVVCALNAHCAARLSGKIKKQYLAIATGRYEKAGTIEKPIYRPDPIKTYRTADDRGDYALTMYEPVEAGENYTLLRVDLATGRTHQIRVHFAYLGTPLYGDTMYGAPHKIISHQALHCENLTFTHPVSGEEITLRADMPEDMRALLASLRDKTKVKR